jgi:prepilin-type N-terminal cleavage/methylation domain-containing protein/prepilin-type processing-associated H-X9-DG protein
MSQTVIPSFTITRRAFTLIELLVVIAIIAILAAILFPVFAQAREKARQSSCASNEKQLGLAIIQYTSDYDGTFPIGWNQGEYINGAWPIRIAPYVKNLGVFVCPSDAKGGEASWAGIKASYAANGYISTNSYPFPLQGPMGFQGTGFIDNVSLNDSQIVRSAESILLTEKHSAAADNLPDPDGQNPPLGNTTGMTSRSVIGGDPMSWAGWAYAPLIPNGSRAEAKYPNGKNGGVSVHGGQMANFLFCDGHVKAMKPDQTNPQTGANDTEKASKNMWDCTRL